MTEQEFSEVDYWRHVALTYEGMIDEWRDAYYKKLEEVEQDLTRLVDILLPDTYSDRSRYLRQQLKEGIEKAVKDR
jgi:hypothetical protein